MRLPRLIAPVLCLLAVAFSCSLEKRHYSSGYFVNWKKYKKENINTKETQTAVVGNEKTSMPEPLSDSSSNEYSLSASNEKIIEVTVHEDKNIFRSEDCDTIYLQSKAKIVGKITEVGIDKIRYKSCNNLSGPEYVISKAEIMYIRYSTGRTEDFMSHDNPPTAQYNENGALIHKYASSSKIFGIVSLLTGFIGIVLAIVAIVKADKAIQLIRQSRGNYANDLSMAKTGKTLAIIKLAITACALLIVLAAFSLFI